MSKNPYMSWPVAIIGLVACVGVFAATLLLAAGCDLEPTLKIPGERCQMNPCSVPEILGMECWLPPAATPPSPNWWQRYGWERVGAPGTAIP